MSPAKKHDVINPKHYDMYDIEVIELMEMTSTDEEFEGYLRNTHLKYMFRYKFKNDVEDLKKSEWFTDKLIKHRMKVANKKVKK